MAGRGRAVAPGPAGPAGTRRPRPPGHPARRLGGADPPGPADRARAAGIRRFTALVSTENDAGIRLLRRLNAEFARREADTVEYEIALRPTDTHRRPDVLRATSRHHG